MARRARKGAVGARLPRLAVAGHVNIDHHLTVDRLPAPDRTAAVLSRHSELGGTAANLARAARSAGLPVAIIARVGPDFPPTYRAVLTRARIDLSGLETVGGAATPSCVIAHDPRGGQMTFIDQGPMGDGARSAPIPERLLGRCRWLHLGTGDPGYLLRLQRAARARGLRVALDPAQEIHYRWDRPTFTAALRESEVFFGNEAEAERARTLVGVASVERLTEHVPLVVVTRGARGARAFTRRGKVDAPAHRRVQVADPTGAGDAFRGGFYAAWLSGERVEDSLSAGTRTAATWLAARHRPPRRVRP